MDGSGVERDPVKPALKAADNEVGRLAPQALVQRSVTPWRGAPERLLGVLRAAGADGQ